MSSDKVYDMQQHVQLIKINIISTPKRILTDTCLNKITCYFQEQFTGIEKKIINVLQNECAPMQTVINIESHQL